MEPAASLDAFPLRITYPSPLTNQYLMIGPKLKAPRKIEQLVKDNVAKLRIGDAKQQDHNSVSVGRKPSRRSSFPMVGQQPTWTDHGEPTRGIDVGAKYENLPDHDQADQTGNQVNHHDLLQDAGADRYVPPHPGNVYRV